MVSYFFRFIPSLSPPFLNFFFFNDTATTEIYTLSLHDALPISTISVAARGSSRSSAPVGLRRRRSRCSRFGRRGRRSIWERSEEHTSELQSQSNLVCRLLLEKKKKLYHHFAASKYNSFVSVSAP